MFESYPIFYYNVQKFDYELEKKQNVYLTIGHKCSQHSLSCEKPFATTMCLLKEKNKCILCPMWISMAMLHLRFLFETAP